MKFKIQKSKLELTLQNSDLCKTRVLFSFENKLLNNLFLHFHIKEQKRYTIVDLMRLALRELAKANNVR